MKMCLAPCFKGCTDERYAEEASSRSLSRDPGTEPARRTGQRTRRRIGAIGFRKSREHPRQDSKGRSRSHARLRSRPPARPTPRHDHPARNSDRGRTRPRGPIPTQRRTPHRSSPLRHLRHETPQRTVRLVLALYAPVCARSRTAPGRPNTVSINRRSYGDQIKTNIERHAREDILLTTPNAETLAQLNQTQSKSRLDTQTIADHLSLFTLLVPPPRSEANRRYHLLQAK